MGKLKNAFHDEICWNGLDADEREEWLAASVDTHPKDGDRWATINYRKGRLMRLPDPTLRNALVTPLLLLRVPVVLLGRALAMLGASIEWAGNLVPAWTDYRRRGRS